MRVSSMYLYLPKKNIFSFYCSTTSLLSSKNYITFYKYIYSLLTVGLRETVGPWRENFEARSSEKKFTLDRCQFLRLRGKKENFPYTY